MFDIAKLFRRSPKPAVAFPSARPGLETFEGRIVPAGVVYQAAAHQVYIEGSQLNDSVLVSANSRQLVVTLNGKTSTFNLGSVQRILFRGLNGNDFFINRTVVSSTAYGDAGNDRLTGGAGNDRLFGGAGNDLENGAGGNDILQGGLGSDNLQGGVGNDSIQGNEGNDVCTGGAGNDALNGGDGNDVENGNEGADNLAGVTGNDTLNGGDGNDVANGGDGEDVCTGGTGDDDLNGQAGDDDLSGDQGDDSLDGGDGNDELDGGDGNDDVCYDEYDDVFNCELDSFVAFLNGSGANGYGEVDPGADDQSLRIVYSGLTPGATYDVQVDGVSVGQLVATPSGNGRFEVSDDSLSVQAGSVLTIFDAQGGVVLQGSFLGGANRQDDSGGDGGDCGNAA